MQTSTFYVTSAVCHLTWRCFYGCPKCEWKLIPILRDQPLSTPSRWEVSGWLNWSLWPLLRGKDHLTERRMASQGQWPEMFSHYTYVTLRTPQSTLNDWERITASGKVQSITWHLRHRAILKEYSKEVKWSQLKGSQLWMWPQPQDPCDSDSSSERLCLRPPISGPHCHESPPYSARIMCLFIPCMVEREAGTPRELDVEARITHVSKGLEFCNPLNTSAFRNLF